MEDIIENNTINQEESIVADTNSPAEDSAPVIENVAEQEPIAQEDTQIEIEEQPLSFWKKLKQKNLEKRIWRYSLEGDKKYRGPLSVFALRVIAWICIVITQVAAVFSIAGEVAGLTVLGTVSNYLQLLSSLSMPLFLLANYAYIIQNKHSAIRMVLTYLLMTLVVAGVFYLIYLHYIVGFTANLMSISYNDAFEMLGSIIMVIFSGTFKFNFFLDLFICTLFVYFALGKPKKHFQGEKIIWFRLLMIIPLGYELATIILKILAIDGTVTIPFLMTPFMPTKNPIIFLVFIFLVFFESKRYRNYKKYNNGSTEQYEEYFKSNKNSWLFAKSAAKIFAFVGVLDLILYAIFALIPVADPETTIPCAQIISTLELGESAGLLLLAPYILLFSYNRMFKPSKMDLFLPALAIIAIVVVWMEAVYQAAAMLVLK